MGRRLNPLPYEARTRDLVVRVSPYFLPDQSDPEDRRWVWGYDVEIENHGAEVVQLISRHWVITDALGRIEEVEGDGVVGEQPVLKPGEAFRYTSGCPLTTASGVMEGEYRMVTSDGETFEALIPPFSLDLPDPGRVVN
jgi:ApaG protein